MSQNNIYKCVSTSGGGEEQISFWEIKQTPKTMQLECIEIKTIWGRAEEGQKYKIFLQRPRQKHGIRFYDDEFVVYFDQDGTPNHFTKL